MGYVRPRDAWKEAQRRWGPHWHGMPEFIQPEAGPVRELVVRFRTEADVRRFFSLVGRGTPAAGDRWSSSLWWPEREWEDLSAKVWVGGEGPRHPVYVPTKGRWEKPLTIETLRRTGVPFRAVVEPQEADAYAEVLGGREHLLVLPFRDRGLVETRNWIWDHAEASGAPWFWTFDDNIRGFYRLNRNLKYEVRTGAMLRVLEVLAARYRNVILAGFHYHRFVPRLNWWPALRFNARVYSNMLIRTGARDPSGRPYRNEGFYNDDTDLCLRILKDGGSTLLLYALLVDKADTMTVEGGMTPYYRGRGRLRMARELQRKHPDVVTVTRKWGRWQHQVDYRPFERNDPGLDVAVPEGADEFGMRLVDR